MASRIEAVTGLDWVEALCRAHGFSEYMLYGYFVQNEARFPPSTPSLRARHASAIGIRRNSARVN